MNGSRPSAGTLLSLVMAGLDPALRAPLVVMVGLDPALRAPLVVMAGLDPAIRENRLGLTSPTA
jgi:hypothetical protein